MTDENPTNPFPAGLKLFLFGAGASAFSDTTGCPPIGAALFGELQKLGGAWSRLDISLAKLFERNFEEGMAEYIRLTPDIARQARLTNEMAAYLAQFRAGPNSYYRRLTAALKASGEPCVFASLNYDLMLEEAIAALYPDVVYDARDWHSPEPLVLKLHGSVNLLPPPGLRIYGSTSNETPKMYDGPAQFVGRQDALAFLASGQDLTPVFAMYEPEKKTLVAPAALKLFQDDWASAIEVASAVFVVGASVAEQDVHVWKPLARSSVPMYVVDPNFEPFDAWSRKRARAGVSHLCRFFSDCCDLVIENLR
jgi:hypothetical protein